MYLAIDFLITPELKFYLTIEWTSRKVYGKTFKDYIHSLPFIGTLKSFQIWVDGAGPFPKIFHPGLRLEDKWNQYQLIKAIAPMPETIVLDLEDLVGADRFIERKKKVLLKRRIGRDEGDWQVISEPSALWKLNLNHITISYKNMSKVRSKDIACSSARLPSGENLCACLPIFCPDPPPVTGY